MAWRPELPYHLSHLWNLAIKILEGHGTKESAFDQQFALVCKLASVNGGQGDWEKGQDTPDW